MPPQIDFDVLLAQARRAQHSHEFSLSMESAAWEAGAALGRILNAAHLTMKNVEALIPSDREIVLRGSLTAGLRADAELRFFNDRPLGYCMSFATSDPRRLLPADLVEAVRLIDIEALCWTLSSRPFADATMAMPSFKASALQILKGDNFHVQVRSSLLQKLNLGGKTFALASDQGVFKLFAPVQFHLGSILELEGGQVSIGSDGSLAFEGQTVINLLGLQLRTRSLFRLASDRMSVRLPFPTVQIPERLPFAGLTLMDNHVGIEGRLDAPTYAIGADGRFQLPASENGGRYKLQYAAGNTSSIPDMIELTAEKLTVSDAINLVSPVSVVLPPGLDSAVKIQDAFVYYAAKNMNSPGGLSLDAGFAARASVSAFGYPAYLCADADHQGTRVQLLFNPLEIRGVIALRGDGVARPPKQYRGKKFSDGAIALELDTRNGHASTAIAVQFLDEPIGRVRPTFEEGALRIQTEVKVSTLGNLSVTAQFGHTEAQLQGGFGFAVTIPVFDAFNLAASISGMLVVKQSAGGESGARVTATLDVPGFSVAANFHIATTDIRDLANRVYKTLLKETLDKLQQASRFLEAYLRGAIAYVGQAADAVERVALVLAEQFRTSVEDAIKLVASLNGPATFALDLIRKGALAWGQFSYDSVLKTVRAVFQPDEVLRAVDHWAHQFSKGIQEVAEAVAWMLHRAGFAVQEIQAQVWRHLQKVGDFAQYAKALTWGNLKAPDIAKALAAINAPVAIAAKAVGQLFGSEVLTDALTAGYGAAAAERVVRDVTRELGGAVGDVAGEVKRGACRRFGICL